jgi:hypothetical protein
MAMRATTLNQRRHEGHYADSIQNVNDDCPNHATGVKLPDDFVPVR